MREKPGSIDEYLATLPDDQRAALETLRRQILAAAPGAEECISYGVPAFRFGGRMLLAFGAAKQHCALYPGAFPIEHLKAELAGRDTSKGTVRFAPDRPLPADLVHRLVQARIDEQTRLAASRARPASGGGRRRTPG